MSEKSDISGGTVLSHINEDGLKHALASVRVALANLKKQSNRLGR